MVIESEDDLLVPSRPSLFKVINVARYANNKNTKQI